MLHPLLNPHALYSNFPRFLFLFLFCWEGNIYFTIQLVWEFSDRMLTLQQCFAYVKVILSYTFCCLSKYFTVFFIESMKMVIPFLKTLMPFISVAQSYLEPPSKWRNLKCNSVGFPESSPPIPLSGDFIIPVPQHNYSPLSPLLNYLGDLLFPPTDHGLCVYTEYV